MKYQPVTIPEQLEKGFRLYEPGSPILSTKRNGEWITTTIEQFREQVEQFAMGLYELGIRKGDKVSLHSENSTEWVICDQAILSLGAVSVPIYSTQPGDQIEFILENSGSKIHIVSSDELFSETKPLIKKLESVTSVISLTGTKHASLKSYDSILEMGRERLRESPELFEEMKSKVGPEDLATLIYTSGTTGTPKGVMLSHNNIASNVQASIERVPFTQEEILGADVLSYLPLSHVFERLITYIYLSMGGHVHYIEHVEEIRDDFLHVRPFFFATVPRLLEKIHTGIKVRGQQFSGIKKQLYYWAVYLAESYDPENPPSGLGAVRQKIADKLVYAKVRELFGGNLRGMISGGAALSPDLFRFINALGIYCGQGYGLTETSPVISVQQPGELRVGSSGKPLTDVEVKIAEDNEILTRGPHVMHGYYNQEEMTREVLTEDGWFHTGDVGKLDEDGHLYITDRKKAMFKLSTGKYVSPQNIENKLAGSGFIEQAIVIGYQRKFCSALIAPSYDNVLKRLRQSGYEPQKPFASDDKIRELISREVEKVNNSLPPWETVKKFELLEEALTIDDGALTPTMKVKRSVVRERFADFIEKMYAEEKQESD